MRMDRDADADAGSPTKKKIQTSKMRYLVASGCDAWLLLKKGF